MEATWSAACRSVPSSARQAKSQLALAREQNAPLETKSEGQDNAKTRPRPDNPTQIFSTAREIRLGVFWVERAPTLFRKTRHGPATVPRRRRTRDDDDRAAAQRRVARGDISDDLRQRVRDDVTCDLWERARDGE